jgi:glycosyltransferase involved in cell wall biosynthesis
MRILHLDGFKGMRGGQWQVLRLLEAQAAAGVEFMLLARENGPLFRAAQEKDWRVERLGLTHVLSMSRHYDLLHAHDGHGHTFGAMVAPDKLVVSRRVAFPVRSRVKFARARHYLAVSEFVKCVLREGGVPEERISVVYDGVPLLEPSHGTMVMAPATDDPQKGSALALEGAALAGVELRLAGELVRQLQEAKVFVYITHSEGLGSGALLAMSAGLPVIASKVGGLREVIQDGENGLLVENDARVIAAAIRTLLEDGGFAQRLGAAARQTSIDKVTVDHRVRRTMEVYRQVLS